MNARFAGKLPQGGKDGFVFGAPPGGGSPGPKPGSGRGAPGGTGIPAGSGLLPAGQALPVSPTHRSPLLSLRLPGSFLLRFDTRAFLALLFHEPPRNASALFPFLDFRKTFRRRLRRRSPGRRKSQNGKQKREKEQREIHSPTHRSP